MNVSLKYCGSCNPRIDLSGLACQLRSLLSADAVFVSLLQGNPDAVIVLNGCPTACADRPDVRELAQRAIIVAGEAVGNTPVPEPQLAATVAKLILDKVRHDASR